nr:hypothetical protein [Euryarchaeota archaeon]
MKLTIPIAIGLSMILINPLWLNNSDDFSQISPAWHSSYYHEYDEENYNDSLYWENERLVDDFPLTHIGLRGNFLLYNIAVLDADGIPRNSTLVLQDGVAPDKDLNLRDQKLVCMFESSAIVRNSTVVSVIDLNNATTFHVGLNLSGRIVCDNSRTAFYQIIGNNDKIFINTYSDQNSNFTFSNTSSFYINIFSGLMDVKYDNGSLYFLRAIDKYNRTISSFNLDSSEFSSLTNVSSEFRHRLPWFVGDMGLGSPFDVRNGKIAISMNESQIEIIDIKNPNIRTNINITHHRSIWDQEIMWLELGCNNSVLFSSSFKNFPSLGVVYSFNQTRIAAVADNWEEPLHDISECKIAYKFDYPWNDELFGIQSSMYMRNSNNTLMANNLSLSNVTLLDFNESKESISALLHSDSSVFDKRILANFTLNLKQHQWLTNVKFLHQTNKMMTEGQINITDDDKFTFQFTEINMSINKRNEEGLSFSNYQNLCTLLNESNLNGTFIFTIDDYYLGLFEVELSIENLSLEFSNFDCPTSFMRIDIIPNTHIVIEENSGQALFFNFTNYTSVIYIDSISNLKIQHLNPISFNVELNGLATSTGPSEFEYEFDNFTCINFMTQIITSLNYTNYNIICLEYWEEGNSTPPLNETSQNNSSDNNNNTVIEEQTSDNTEIEIIGLNTENTQNSSSDQPKHRVINETDSPNKNILVILIELCLIFSLSILIGYQLRPKS